MRAVAHTGGGRFEVASVPDPVPGPGELILRVRSCGICGSDLKVGAMMPSGAVLGHEFCGEVVAAGRDAKPVWPPTNLVASMPLQSCGTCRWCLVGEVAHCEMVDFLGLGATAGAFAEYVKVSAAVTVPLPEEAADSGALVEPLAVGLHAVRAAKLRAGDRVLVIGAGAVGSAAVAWARRLGAGEIVVSDPSDERRAAALEVGASGGHDPATGIMSEHFDVVFECVGGAGMAETAIDRADVRGRVILAGVCTVPDQIQHLSGLTKEVAVRYVVYYTAQEFALAARLVADRSFDSTPLIAGRTSFEGFDSTFHALATGETTGKYLVDPSTTSGA